ncbi:SMI1/KNR4 family protein [Streptomyces sp. NPDC002520]
MTTTSPDQRPAEATLEFLRSAFEPEWREQPLGYEAVEAWESEHGVALPEPYRTVVAEICDGYGLGPPEDGGLERLGCLPTGWPDLGSRQPGAPFPLVEGWPWEDDASVDPDEDERIDAVYTQGSVVLGSEDGQSFWLLVTTGPRRGEVWMVADVGAGPVPGDEAWGFLEWVQRWHAGNGWWD